MSKVAVYGVGGRMGRTVVQVIHETDGLRVVVGVDGAASPMLGRDVGVLAGLEPMDVPVVADVDAIAGADVVIDFSLPAALPALFEACAAHSVPLVLATTGLEQAHRDALAQLAREVPVVAAPNYSTGVSVLFHLAARAAALLPGFDAEIVEMHHHHKVDAPSGTALGLAESVAGARGQALDKVANFGREGLVGARPEGEIGVTTLRGGDVVGDHTLILAGPSERLEISHRAGSRALFARGAVRAAGWLVGKAPGMYGMDAVLGLA